LPKGDRKSTDTALLRKLSLYDRPITLQELAKSLSWNTGRVDGSINRLQSLHKVATVKLSPPQGHSYRVAGLPDRRYWTSFIHNQISNKKNILIDDPLNVASEYFQTNDKNIKQTLLYEREIINLKKKNRMLQERLDEFISIDPQMLRVLREFQPKIEEYAIKLGHNDGSELLRKMLLDELDENIPFFKELVKIFLSVYRETENPILRDVIAKAQAAVERG
jgi:hypothetical protein